MHNDSFPLIEVESVEDYVGKKHFTTKPISSTRSLRLVQMEIFLNCERPSQMEHF